MAIQKPEWMHKLKHGGAVALRDLESCSNGWAFPPGDMFQIRSASYLDTKVKTAGGRTLLEPLAFDWIKCSSKIFNIMWQSNGRVRTALDEARRYSREQGLALPFVWAFNLQVPSSENHSLVMYYVSFDEPPKDSLMQRFLDGDDTFRNSRFKLLANVVEGPWPVRTAVGESVVCLLGKAISCSYTRGEDFMEIDADIGSSLMANAIVHVALSYVTSLTIDLAFVLEGQTYEELPEKILGTIRFAGLDPALASMMDVPLEEDLRESLPSVTWRLLPAGNLDSVANIEEEKEGEDVDDDGDDDDNGNDDEEEFQDSKESF